MAFRLQSSPALHHDDVMARHGTSSWCWPPLPHARATPMRVRRLISHPLHGRPTLVCGVSWLRMVAHGGAWWRGR